MRGMQTQAPKQGRGTFATHFVAFAAGGTSVLLAAYGYYHYSGLAALVARANAAKARYVEVRTAWKDNRPRTASDAVVFLRSLSRSRSGPVPDAFVDMVAQFQGAHEEDIDRIVFGACDDIHAIIAKSPEVDLPEEDGGAGEQGLTSEEKRKIGTVVQKRGLELKEKLRSRHSDNGVVKGGDEDRRAFGAVMTRWKARREGEQKSSGDDKHD
ncbi:hypothetical protein PHLGIDRAFT_127026 [Phlebiopsis gigantea 11061_1 CR5-6]|uniref:Uncharacterized protein n=1 Tax=Phlebiopsis gigantea (strain 11061_1 CR5-6) TaxID=745531 RepID=A0A0C3S9L2_PHLG1|nr:hypothetical protein PHLGIDRAFT_127026 [Phlebiopsis gigantea 11061_1 CR5-6]